MRLTLKGLRNNLDLTQKEMAEKLGVSEATWRNYEQYKTFPDIIMIQKMEKEFNISYDDIIFLPRNTV